MNMVKDFNMAYLRNMNIMPMGDIIAILRYAKSVYQRNTCEKVPPTTESWPSSSSQQIEKQTLPVFARLGGYDDLNNTNIENSSNFTEMVKHTNIKNRLGMFQNYIYKLKKKRKNFNFIYIFRKQRR